MEQSDNIVISLETGSDADDSVPLPYGYMTSGPVYDIYIRRF